MGFTHFGPTLIPNGNPGNSRTVEKICGDVALLPSLLKQHVARDVYLAFISRLCSKDLLRQL